MNERILFDAPIDTAYSHLLILTRDDDWPTEVDDQAIHNRLQTHPQGLALHTDDDLAVRMRIRLIEGPIPDDPDDQHVVDGAIDLSSGRLSVVAIPTGDEGTLRVRPGTYAYRFTVRGLESSRRCEGDGQEVLTLSLWRGIPRPTQVIRRYVP